MKKAGNFWESLHVVDYLSPYRQNHCMSNQLLTTKTGKEETLNGFWNYCPDPYDWGIRDRWFEKLEWSNISPRDHDFTSWPVMKLPCCWNTFSPDFFWYENTMCYYREFYYQASDSEERIFLKFDGIQYAAYIFLNGVSVAYHAGGSTPFSFELGKNLQEGKNKIVIFAENRRSPDRVPTDNTDWFNYGGIYRDIHLVRTPKSFIKDMKISLVPNSRFKKIKVIIDVDGFEKLSTAHLKMDGLFSGNIEITAPHTEITLDISPELWHPDSPKLYDISLEYEGRTIIDRIGFREISVEGTKILLNGSPIYLKGACIHEDSPTNGKAVSDEEVRENYRLIKEMNGNFARLSHYPHAENAARIADEMGILLWEEIPVYWAINFENNHTFLDAENQLKEMILRDFNRASVIIWSVGNENEDTDPRLEFMKKLVQTCRDMDSTRLVSAACLVNFQDGTINDRLTNSIDIIGMNEYFGWYYSDFEGLKKMFSSSKCDKPVVITEFGACARAGHHGTERQLFTEEQQRWVYENQTKLFAQTDYVQGVAAWLLFDFRTPHRMNQYQQGYNRKGLVNEDKTHRKQAYYVMKEFFKKR